MQNAMTCPEGELMDALDVCYDEIGRYPMANAKTDQSPCYDVYSESEWITQARRHPRNRILQNNLG